MTSKAENNATEPLIAKSAIEAIYADETLTAEQRDEKIKKLLLEPNGITEAESAQESVQSQIDETIEAAEESTAENSSEPTDSETDEAESNPTEDPTEQPITEEQQASLDEALAENNMTEPVETPAEPELSEAQEEILADELNANNISESTETDSEEMANKEKDALKKEAEDGAENTANTPEVITEDSPEHHEGIDTNFENFLNTQLDEGLIDAETIKKAKASLDDPEAQTLLKMFGNTTAFNFGTTVFEPLVVGSAAVKTLSVAATAAAWINYNGIASVAKFAWNRWHGRHLESPTKTALKSCIPFVGPVLVMRELVKKHPELVNCFFAEKMSKRPRRKLEENKELFAAEQAKESPDVEELKYLKQQIKKWEQRKTQNTESGMNYIPKWENRWDGVKRFGGKIKDFFTNPFRSKT